MGIIKFLIITLIVLWVIRLLLRMIFPMVIKNVFSNMQQQAQQQYQQRPNRPEGSISIDYMPEKEKKKGNTDNLGDFVDYEEVK
ncbi:DUF4834 family protein [Nubsella zeaxanthinifaciens]|jgi:hypothetical protein|uniref:DUF4834 family protein n=1 Tax=Nubsella zeaxanthinifaciens TaxID=392412 RepID=UPI000DE2F7A4|nr:DUF4834 family protein [Nubsella zeaxanthinifaciens]